MRRLPHWLLLLWASAGTAAAAGFDYPMQARQVADKVYAIVTPTRDLPNPQNGGWNSNSAFVVTGDGVLLFDSGSSTAIGQALKDTIAGVTPQPVRWIVNSHAHGDHWLGNAAFADSVEQIFATPEVITDIGANGAGWVETFDRMTGGVTGSSEILPPGRAIANRTEMELGGERIVLMLSGGSHSPGDLMAWLPRTRVLLGGDVIYSDRMPSTNAGNLAHWIETLGRLRELEPRTVVPGHGDLTDLAGIERLQALLQALWAAVEAGIDDGLSDYEMLPRVTEALAAFEPGYPGLEEKLKRDISHVYLQVEAAAFD